MITRRTMRMKMITKMRRTPRRKKVMRKLKKKTATCSSVIWSDTATRPSSFTGRFRLCDNNLILCQKNEK